MRFITFSLIITLLCLGWMPLTAHLRRWMGYPHPMQPHPAPGAGAVAWVVEGYGIKSVEGGDSGPW